MKKKPFFSIITCTYNSEKYVQANIDSVKNQTFTDYKHVFIDGQSKDKTQSILRKYQKSSKQKVIVKTFPAQGIANAFNLGIKHSSGKYLIHMNSDDLFHDHQVLEDVHQFLVTQDEPDWIYGKASVIEENGKQVGIFPNRWILQQAWAYLLKFFPFVPHQAVFIKKTVFDKFGGFDESLRSKMDPDLWIRIKDKTKWKFFNRIICRYMIRPDAHSSSAKVKKQGQEDFKKVQKRYMNEFEYYLARILNKLISMFNSTLR